LDKKSLLIVSLLQGVPIGHFMVQVVRENKQKFRNILDGKQRLTSIRDYVKGKFTLSLVDYVSATDDNGEEILVDVSGLTFEQLPKQFQDKITATILEFKCFEMDDDLKSVLFYRWNNGESLKPSEKRKAKMSVELLQAIDDIKKQTVFQCGFTETALKRDTNGDAVQQAMTILLTDGDTSLDGKTLDQIVDENAFTDNVIAEMKQITEYLNQAAKNLEEKEQKKVFTKNKLTAMVLAAREAIKNGITAQVFSDWLYLFFVKEYKERGFEQYASGSTAKKENVKKRIQIMMNDFQQFVSENTLFQIPA
jgi:Protein of unknown function DUF262.